MTGIHRVALGSALLIALTSGAAWAQPPTIAPDFSLTVGTRLWLTSGYADEQTSIPGINPLSDLRWRGTDGIVSELFVDAVWKRLVVRSTLGLGAVLDGAFIDEDFAANNRNNRFSVTRSSVEGDDILNVSGDIGVRTLRWSAADGRPGFLDLLVGYQYWRESYEAFGATGVGFVSFNPPVTIDAVVPSDVKVITQDFIWQSIRVGGRVNIPLPARFGLRGEAMFIPWTSFELRDVHQLRTDLRQDPSFVQTGTGGFGYELEGALTYTIWRTLAVEAGFRYWKLESGDGDAKARTVNGTVNFKFEGATTERYGPFIGLQYRF
jgi:hypothetical protein